MPFGPFKPVVVQPAGWYFRPVGMTLTKPSNRLSRSGERLPSSKVGSPPVVVLPEGWYFKPIKVVLTQPRITLSNQRLPHSPYYLTPKAVIPTNTVAPVASGTAQDGQTLSTTDGTWTGTPTVTVGSGYQWQTASDAGFTTAVTDIGGATASTYLLTAAEIGLYVRAIVMATNVAAIGLGYSNALGPVIA
jgi:hypothetical protein